MNDCSWYTSCNLRRLGTTNSQMHRTFPVRHRNGSLLQSVQARLSAPSNSNNSRWVHEPRRVWFHEESPAHLLLNSRAPSFEKPPRGWTEVWQPLGQLREWTSSIASGRWAAGASSSQRWGSCAVVGSSAALLASSLGSRIDAHDTIIRMNEAPVTGFEQHVGARTTHRIWGCQHLPDDAQHWSVAGENIILYCPAVGFGGCWTVIPASPRPRLSPFAWEEASVSIHGFQHAKAVKTKPTAGAMGVWVALAQCQSTTAYGFGWCGGRRRANTSHVLKNAVYYDPTDKGNKSGFS
jgi:hypothetical protein